MIIRFNTKKFTNMLKTMSKINSETRLKVFNWKLESCFVDYTVGEVSLFSCSDPENY